MGKVYTAQFELFARRNNVNPAYKAIERVRGRIVTELIVSNPRLADLDTLDPQVEAQLTAVKLDLVKASSEKDRRRLIDQAFFLETKRWSQNVPRHESAVLSSFDVRIDQLRQVLRSDEALIEYVLDDPHSYCLLIDKNRASIFPLKGKKEIEAASDELLSKLRQQQVSQAEGQRLAGLVAPPELESYRYLTIVPDGRLHLVPFDALIRPDRSYWGKNQTISYTPSAATEFVLRTRKRQARPDDRTFLGVGSVNYGAAKRTDAVSPPTPRSSQRRVEDEAFDPSQMRQLPDSLEEVRSAAALVDPHATLETGDNATKTAFYDVKPQLYKIIHFAVHAITDVNRPDRAALILRIDPPRSDGRLEARDILRLRLRCELVVLSACDTAVGRLQGEEGIANLTRAWLAAGADSVVSTLWPVDDSFTLYLMKRFYEHLALGVDKASALHRAKLDLLKQFGEDTPPVFWAGFTLTGAGTSTVDIKAKVHLGENK
jgi:CHAT domain-containing protein